MPTSVHIPKQLLTAVDRRAKQLGLSRNRLIIRALERDVAEETTWSPGFFEKFTPLGVEDSKALDETFATVRANRKEQKAPEALRYVLDTNIASEWIRGTPQVILRLRAAAKTDVSIPQPVLAELAYGIERLPRSKRRELLQDRYTALRAEVARTPWTDAVSAAFGTVKSALERRGERIEDFDAAVAAHALAANAVLVTTNVKHMERVPGLLLEDWSSRAR